MERGTAWILKSSVRIRKKPEPYRYGSGALISHPDPRPDSSPHFGNDAREVSREIIDEDNNPKGATPHREIGALLLEPAAKSFTLGEIKLNFIHRIILPSV